MANGSNEALCRRWFDEVWNQGLEASVDALFVNDGVARGLGQNETDVHGPAGFKVFLRNMRSAFPDTHIKVEDVFEDGDKAAVRFSFTATHLGDGLGMPATGRTVRVNGISIIRIANGQIAEAWNSWDQLGMLQQIGASPADESDKFLATRA